MLKQLDRWSRRAVVAVLLLLPAILFGAVRAPIGASSVHEWLPDGRIERQRYERFLEEFGSDQFVLVSWDECKIDDPRLAAFCQRLTDSQPPETRWIASVQATPEVLEALTADPIRLPLIQAARRLKGVLVGPRGLCAAVATISPYGLEHQAETIAHIERSADAVPGLGHDRLRLAGSIVESYSVDAAAARSFRQLVIPASVLGIVLACACLRSWSAAVAVLIIAGIGQLMAIAAVYYTGGQFSAVLIVLPTLVFMLTLSSAVHLMNYYVDVAAHHDDHLGARAMLLGFKPSVLASLTTALGMASLVVSQLGPVREFGLYSSITLCLASAFLLLAFPCLSDWFYGRTALAIARKKRAAAAALAEPATMSSAPARGANDAAAESHESTTTELFLADAEASIDADTHAAVISPLAQRYAGWMQRHAIAVSAGGFVLIALSLLGLMKLKPSTKFDDMFPAGSSTVRNMVWLEKNLGPIASVEVLLRFPKQSKLDTYDRIVWVDRVTNSIRDDQRLGTAISAATFLPALPQTGAIRDVARRSLLRKNLPQSLPFLAEQGWLAEDNRGQVWRVTAKVSATAEEDYGVLTDRVVERVRSVAAETGQAQPFAIEVTGLYPVMHDTQLALIDDLGISFTAAFILITPVMMLIARGFWAGLLIMLPNVLPETLVFGGMAWLGLRLDIAGLLTASVAMGIAVNDTLHFVNWYARRLSHGDSRRQAVADTLTGCAGAMFHTMLISCCSMLPFLFADFVPTRQFAFLMIAMMSSALLGDLVLLPALLLSPLGRCVEPRRRSSSESVAA